MWPARRRAAWCALIVAVVAAHLVFGLRVAASVIGWNGAPAPRRIEISFSQALAPSQPPTPVAAAPAAPAPTHRPPRAVRDPRARAEAASSAASLAEESDRAREADPAGSAARAGLEQEALALAAEIAEAQAAAAASAASAASAAPSPAASAATTAVASASAASATADAVAGPARKPMAWPPSTRLAYTLTGLYRGGPIYGKAVIEWRRSGTHYQVQFDVHVSPFFDQRMSSDGEITDQGLSPRRYDERFDVPLLASRVRRIEFTDADVVLPNGNRVIRFPQTQDEASQFVQFVWLFATRPALLRAGTLVDFPLALASGVRRWTYRVDGTETLPMAFGQIDTVHLKPVREGPRRANEYPFEFWTAPTLQYLPVRVLVPLDDKNFADLSLDALPLQAAPEDDKPQPQENPPP